MANSPINNVTPGSNNNNVTPGSNPLNVGENTANQLLDPFNMLGWNTPNPIDPYSGQPSYPGYSAAYDPSTMGLSDYLSGKYDTSALTAFKDQAMRKGPSQWGLLAQQQNLAQTGQQRERAGAESNAQTAQAMDKLAANGGLSSGARERAALEGAKNYLGMSQDASRQGDLNSTQIGMNDEQNRIQQLSSLPGMEMEQAKMYEGAKQQDIANTMAENERRNKYNMDLYQTRANMWGAGKQAEATQNSGGGGSSFICSALKEAGLMSGRETKKMLTLMLSAIFTRADFFAWYFSAGEKAVTLAKRQNFDWSKIKGRFVTDFMGFDLRNKAQLLEAQNLYIERAAEFCQMFLGEETHFKESYCRPGLFKSLLALPRVFSRVQTYTWAYGYYTPKIKKYRMRKLFRILGGTT